MRTRFFSTAIGFAAMLLFASSALADSTVTLSKLHLCCGACVAAVNKAVGSVDGASVEVDKAALSATITAADGETAQKAVDAVAAAGFHGVSDNDDIAMKNDSGATEGNVRRVVVSGLHNCCGGCNVAIKKALDTVDGVQANTAKPKSSTLVVEGNFDAQAVVKALNDAGFHVQVQK